jgi:hypothetical protein
MVKKSIQVKTVVKKTTMETKEQMGRWHKEDIKKTDNKELD